MRQPGSIIHLKKIIRKVIYKLKWLYGFPADVYQETDGTYDPETGRRTVTRAKTHIDRMIILPASYHRDIFYSISFLKANSNFAYGGDIELDDRQFIIDGHDLPVNFVLAIGDYIVWDHKQYDIVKLFYLEGDTGYYIHARRPTNQKVSEIIDNAIKTAVIINSEFTEG